MAFVSTMCISAPTLAQQPPSAMLSGNVSLARLIDFSAQQLNVRVDYDPAQLTGSITLRSQDGMTPSELWSFTNTALASRGMTTVRQLGSDGLSVVKLVDAASVARTELHESEPIDRDSTTPLVPAGFANQLVRIEHRAAKDVIDALRPFLSKQGGNAVAVGDSGFVMISDTLVRIEQAKRFLAVLDRTASTLSVEEVLVHNLGAEQLAALATQVAQKRKVIDGQATPGEVLPGPSGNTVLLIAPDSARAAWMELLAQLDKRESTNTKTYQPYSYQVSEVATLIEQVIADPLRADDRFRVVKDELTNTLIVTATPSQHETIEQVVSRLSQNVSHSPRPIRAFRIRNRPVNELLSVLNRLIDAGAIENLSENALGSTSVRDAADQQLLLNREDAPDALTTGPRESLTNSGRPDSYASDKSRSRSEHSGQAEVDSTAKPSPNGIALTADEGTNTIIAIGEASLLAQLEQLLAMLDVRQPQVMLEVTLVSLSDNDALSLGLELEKLDVLGDASLMLSSLFGLSSSGGRGFSGVVLSPGEFSVVARALQTLSNGRSTSIPKVLVTNNQQATFASVLQQPFQTATSSSGGTAQGFGGFQDAGTTISVRPQIAEGDELVLEYSLSLSSFVGGPAAPGLPPPRQQNKVDSLATLPDGYTVVVGGLEFTNRSDSEQRIPGIGAIPLIGELFKSRDNNEGRQRFFVFIRATVLRDARLEDLKYISAKDGGSVGVSDGWPTMQPGIIR